MPYAITHRQGKWVVVNKETGRVLGTHKTRQEALDQVKAVYANANG